MSADRSPDKDAFVEEAKAVDILAGFERSGYSLSSLKRTGAGPLSEYAGPCPSCGGKDRFSVSPAKQVFNCRGHGGGSVVTMAMHITGADFLAACELVAGRDRPNLNAASRVERDAEREAARLRTLELRADAEKKAEVKAAESARYRQKGIDRALRDWNAAGAHHGSPSDLYLAARGLDGMRMTASLVRCHRDLIFWGEDTDGRTIVLHRGPAMLVPFLRPVEGSWRIVGLHRTWIDLSRPPKFRPAIIDPASGKPLPTKKMAGSKSGGLLPVIGKASTSRRMVAGEGIETVLGYAAYEGFRADTFYCAAGDMGNLCGKALLGSRARVEGAVKIDKRGRKRPVFAAGDEPDMDSVCLPVLDSVDELVLLGDGDSEPVQTKAALIRGVSRHRREGRICRGLMAPDGKDWADVAQEIAA
jgi:hypothetical protein